MAAARSRWRSILLTAPLALLVLAGCSRRGGPVPYDASLLGAADRPAPTLPYDLPLGPLDVIHVTVLQVPDLSGDFQVDAHGRVDLPLLGAVDARDRGPGQFAKLLEDLYGARYLNNPDITVRVLHTNATDVTIEGGVRNPGVYPLPGTTRLLTVIALARGVDPDNGNARRCIILRKQGGRTVAAAFDLVSIREGRMVNPIVYPGDTVVIEADTLRRAYRDLVQTLPAIAIFSTL